VAELEQEQREVLLEPLEVFRLSPRWLQRDAGSSLLREGTLDRQVELPLVDLPLLPPSVRAEHLVRQLAEEEQLLPTLLVETSQRLLIQPRQNPSLLLRLLEAMTEVLDTG
jgi:hypothetical protein